MNTPGLPTINIALPPELADYIDERIKAAVEKAISGDKRKTRYLTRKQVCELFDISLPTLSRYVDKGILRGQKIGHRVLFDEASLAASLKDLRP